MKKFVLMAILACGSANAQYFGIETDKTLHILAGTAVTAGSYHVYKEWHHGDTKKAFIYSLITNIIVCSAKEFYDENISTTPGAHGDIKDWGVGVGAGLITGVTLNIFDNQMKKREAKRNALKQQSYGVQVSNSGL